MPHTETLTIKRRDQRTMAERITATLAEWRASWTGPISSKSPEIAALFGAPPSASGVNVSEVSALNHSAVWAAVSIISSDVGSLPLIFYRRLKNGGKERYDAHPLYRILHDEPNPEMTSMVFRETLTAHLITWGNAYSEIERDDFGRPFALWPITPDRIMAFRETDGRLRYRVRNDNGTDTILEMRDVLHIPGLGFDGLTGYSVIAKARESIGVGMAAEKFGSSFYGNGTVFGGVFSHPAKLSPLARDNFERSIDARHKGIDKAHRWILVEEGMKYENTMGINPVDAQFLETRQFQVTEIARWFQIPPHKIGDLEHATFTNIEEQNIDYYRSGLRRWLVRWEQELNRKLVAKAERNLQFAEHLVEGFLRGNSAARSEYYSKMFGIGAFSINDILSLENQNPIGPNGDEHFVPLNMTTVERAIEGPSAPAPPAAPPTPAPEEDPAEEADTQDAAQAARLAELQEELNETLDKLAKVTEERDDARVLWQTSAQQFASVSAELHQSEGTRLHLVEAAMQADHDQQTSTAQHEQAVEDWRRQLLAADALVTTVTLERDRVLADLAEVQTDTARSDAEHAQRHEAAAASLASALMERDGRPTRAEHEKALKELTTHEDLALADRDALITGLRAEVSRYQTDAEQLIAAVQEAGTRIERAEAEVMTEGARAVDALRRAEKAAAAEALAAAAASDGAAQLAASEAARAEAETVAVRVRGQERERLGRAMAAHRGLIADVLQRLIEREVDRVRRHVATPVKLAAWMKQFYATHEDACTEALLPAMRVALAWQLAPGDPIEATRAIARAHVQESVEQLEGIIDACVSVSELHPLVEKLMQRWEAHRATARADEILAGHLAFLRAYERSGS